MGTACGSSKWVSITRTNSSLRVTHVANEYSELVGALAHATHLLLAVVGFRIHTCWVLTFAPTSARQDVGIRVAASGWWTAPRAAPTIYLASHGSQGAPVH